MASNTIKTSFKYITVISEDWVTPLQRKFLLYNEIQWSDKRLNSNEISQASAGKIGTNRSQFSACVDFY